MAQPGRGIPPDLRPDPAEFDFDLERALRSVVGLRADVPADAFTADSLGTERAGSGAVIREDGLVLTIGYLIVEAETIWMVSSDKQAVPGHALAYDAVTGLGLVQPLGRLGLPALPIAPGPGPKAGDNAVMAAAGGLRHAVRTRVVARQEFAGYWEYLLDDAIFTAPAHPFWGGAALIGADGKLLGVGSLSVQQEDRGRTVDMNMVVPARHLLPILDDLLAYGRVQGPTQPWLGLYAAEDGDAVIVTGLADGGPAERAGLRPGDRVLAVGEAEIPDLGGLWRAVRAAGPAGTTLRFAIGRDGETLAVPVTAADRSRFLKSPPLH